MNITRTRPGISRGIALTSAIAATTLGLSACGDGADQAGGTDNAVGVSLIVKTTTNPFFVAMQDGAEAAAEAEGVDRAHMRLAANQLALVREVVALGRRVVVVLAGGAPVELPFADDVDAILHGYLGGQGGGRAIVDLLTGAANPTGRLAETHPLVYDDVPSAATFARTEASAEHRESIYVGYRWFDKADARVRYPFGHGLSYTEFAHTDLEAARTSATVTVTNVGDRAGVDVVQLYIEAPDGAHGAFRAPRELRGFATVAVEPGESATVEIPYAEHAFDVFDAERGDWRTIGGMYDVLVGASSRDIRARASIEIDGDRASDLADPRLPHYASGDLAGVTDAEFETLLGRPLPPARWAEHGPLTRDDIVAQCAGRGGFASALHGLIVMSGRALMALGRPHAANNTRFALELPFRSISRMSAGRVDDPMLDGLLTMVNGRFWRGLRQLWTAWRAHRRTTRATRR